MPFHPYFYIVLLLGISSSIAYAHDQLVSEEMLDRRWPNGEIPIVFSPDWDDHHEAEVRAALFGSTTIQGCQSEPCVGWDAANAVTFLDCANGDAERCAQLPYYAYLITTRPWPTQTNKTRRKRGFSYLLSEDVEDGCDLHNDDRNCRSRWCEFSDGEKCVFDVWLRKSNSTNFMWNAGHELGHMLGFNHEHARPDRASFIDVSNCNDADTDWGPPFHANNFVGTYDTVSIMHYEARSDRCFGPLPGGTMVVKSQNRGPTPKDLAKLQLLYGVRGHWLRNGRWCTLGGRIHLGDFNDDGRTDLLCHSEGGGTTAAGRQWIDLADTSGEFKGTDWQSGQRRFCHGGSKRLLAGDFNGDGHTDIACIDLQTRTISIDHASTSGTLDGKDWPLQGTKEWPCAGSSQTTFVGDFDADGRDDLLCHDKDTGIRSIDLAEGIGVFEGFNWSSTNSGQAEWCFGPDQYLLIGDFDGNNSDDAVCHDRSTGDRWIDFGFSDGALRGTNWYSKSGFDLTYCKGENEQLHAADVNGDGADDLLCHDRRLGSLKVDLSDPSVNWREGVNLTGAHKKYEIAFCNDKDSRLLTGTFNSDSRDDLLCHNRVTGHKAILFALPGGDFRLPTGH